MYVKTCGSIKAANVFRKYENLRNEKDCDIIQITNFFLEKR